MPTEQEMQISDNTSSAILNRIAKLLAVQETRGATEAEASIAAEHVQKLLEQHNLTLADVERHNGSSDEGKRTKDNTLKASPFQPWRVSLMEGIARNHFCLARPQKFYEGKKQRQRLLVIGRDINVRAVKLTYEYLSTTLLRELKAQGFSLTDYTGYSKEGTYFLEGATERVVSRLDIRRREREAESVANAKTVASNGTGRELVLSDVYGSEANLNNDALNNYPPGTTASRRREQQEREARQKKEHDRLVAESVDDTVAWYRAYGYTEEQAASYAKQWTRQSRSRGRAGHSHGAQNWSRRDKSYYEKVTSSAYKAGVQAGNSVGLEAQVGANSAKRIK